MKQPANPNTINHFQTLFHELAPQTSLETLLAHQILRAFLSLDALTAAETQAWITLNDEGNELNLDPRENEAILARAERYANQARVLQGNLIRLIDAYRIAQLNASLHDAPEPAPNFNITNKSSIQ
jgi:hypothetical protein